MASSTHNARRRLRHEEGAQSSVLGGVEDNGMQVKPARACEFGVVEDLAGNGPTVSFDFPTAKAQLGALLVDG